MNDRRRDGRRALGVDDIRDRVAMVFFVGLVAGSLSGQNGLFSSVPRPLLQVALAFLIVELLIPLWVFVDLRRRSDTSGSFWMHVAAMPGINVFGLAAYLQDRKSSREE